MATDKYPNQNVNVPMDPKAVAAARARLAPRPDASPLTTAPAHGKGSRRQIGPGEWIDDRVMEIDSPTSSPSKDSPPEFKRDGKVVPASFDPAKVYQIAMAKPMPVDGRYASPANLYYMVGTVCTALIAADPECILDAVELGDIPVDPDSPPS
jgi:hypothetical protein